jgi:hypothetical protein
MTKKLATMSSLSQFSGIQKTPLETSTEDQNIVTISPIIEESVEEKKFPQSKLQN